MILLDLITHKTQSIWQKILTIVFSSLLIDILTLINYFLDLEQEYFMAANTCTYCTWKSGSSMDEISYIFYFIYYIII